MARSGERRRSLCVSFKSAANCDSRLFRPFSTAEKFVANSQTLPFFVSKVARQLLFCFLFCFFSLAKGAIFFDFFFTARNIEPRRLRRVAAAAACRAATAELYGYTPLHTSSFVVVSNAVVWSPCRTLQNQSETRKVAFCLNLFRSFSVYHFVHAFEHAMGFVSKLCLRFVSVQ